MSGFTWEPSQRARLGLDSIARSGLLGLDAYLEAQARHEADLATVRAAVASVSDPRLVP